MQKMLATTLVLVGCAGAHRPAKLTLDKVVLYQNGIGYFERHGVVNGLVATMMFAPYEINDVLKTVTVIDTDTASLTTIEVAASAKNAAQVPVTMRLSTAGSHRIHVSYAVPTPTWKASYRVVLDDKVAATSVATNSGGLLQGWATINNTSGEDWVNVQLALATGAPMSYAMDLKAPIYVARPDVTGTMIEPIVTDAVVADVATSDALDADGDGITGLYDLCPKEAEDRDGFEDTDGCPDLDNDRDRIPDAKDQCPNDPETYNGKDDEDGCPDRGRVLVYDANIEILDQIYFKKGSINMSPGSQDVLEAIAATLANNPDITLIEIQGHASQDEVNAWSIATERAEAIIYQLRKQGIAASRLSVKNYGATQLLRSGNSSADLAKNRRVSFLILKRNDGAPTTKPAANAITTSTAKRSLAASTSAIDLAGASRYQFAAPLTIPRGGASMVPIINQAIDAEEVYLFRPDSAARGSQTHPFRAVRLHNTSDFTLQPGAVAVFARQSYVGDSLLATMPRDATAFAPFAVDESASVAVTTASDELPLRLVNAARGAVTLEFATRQRTTYTIAPSATPPARMYLRHNKTSGYAVVGLPPGAIEQDDTWLVPVPLLANSASTLVVEERLPQRRSYQIASDQLPDLTLYLAGSKISDVAATALRQAMAQRVAVNTLTEALAELRERRFDQLDHIADVRASLSALGASKDGVALRKKLVADLSSLTATNTASAVVIAEKSRQLVTAQAVLRDLLRDVVVTESK